MQPPLLLTVLALAVTSASAFRVCTQGQDATLKVSARDDTLRQTSQYVLVSPRTENITYTVHVDAPGCERNWTSTFDLWEPKATEVDLDLMGETDKDGRVWYEVSFYTTGFKYTWVMVQLSYNYRQSEVQGKIANCTVDEIRVAFDNATALGHYCAESAPKSGFAVGIVEIITVVAVILGLLIVVDLICFFRQKHACHHKEPFHLEETMSATRPSEEAGAATQLDLEAHPAAAASSTRPQKVSSSMSSQLVSNEVLPDGYSAQEEAEAAENKREKQRQKKKALVQTLVAKPRLMAQFSNEPLVEYL